MKEAKKNLSLEINIKVMTNNVFYTLVKAAKNVCFQNEEIKREILKCFKDTTLFSFILIYILGGFKT